jgi:hypothetical protein
MTFKFENFDNHSDLVLFVNANSVVQGAIAQIVFRDGRWYLFYWA